MPASPSGTPEIVLTLEGHSAPISTLAFAPNGVVLGTLFILTYSSTFAHSFVFGTVFHSASASLSNGDVKGDLKVPGLNMLKVRST